MTLAPRCSLVDSSQCMDQDPYCNPIAAILQMSDFFKALRSKFLFMASSTSIEGYAIRSDGSLAPLPFGLSNMAYTISTIESDAYNVYLGGAALYGYTVTGDGYFTTPVAVQTQSVLVRSLFVSPDEKHLYAGNTDSPSTVFGYTADASLTPLPGVPYSPLGNSCNLISGAITPGGERVYMSSAAWSLLLIYDRDGGSGALSASSSSPYSLGFIPGKVKIHPSGSFLYVNSSVSGTTNVYAYSIDPSTGSLAPLAGSPYALGVANALQVRNMEMSSDGNFIFVSSSGNEIYSYRVDGGTGSLSFVNKLGTGNYPSPMGVDFKSQFLYVGGDNFFGKGLTSIFYIGSDGFLSEAPFSPVLSTTFWPSYYEIQNRYD